MCELPCPEQHERTCEFALWQVLFNNDDAKITCHASVISVSSVLSLAFGLWDLPWYDGAAD
jgi:hypothetical protein